MSFISHRLSFTCRQMNAWRLMVTFLLPYCVDIQFPHICSWYNFISGPVCRCGINTIKGSPSQWEWEHPSGSASWNKTDTAEWALMGKKIDRKKQVKEMELGPRGCSEKGENIRPYSPKPCLPRLTVQTKKRLFEQVYCKVKKQCSTKLALLYIDNRNAAGCIFLATWSPLPGI